MRASDLYEIPVVDKKKLVGVLSFGSMVKKRAMVAGMKVKGMMDIPPEHNGGDDHHRGRRAVHRHQLP